MHAYDEKQEFGHITRLRFPVPPLLSTHLKTHCREEVGREIGESHAEVMSVLGVEAGSVDEVDAAADDVVCREGGPVRLPGPRAAEAVPVVAVVAVGVFVPTG